jgi:CDGSH-type Zn-finger protein
MLAPIQAQKAPYAVAAEAGKKYLWCACGRSAKQPFCDGSHIGSGFGPRPFEVTQAKQVWLCGCKNTKNPPFCDGTHKSL